MSGEIEVDESYLVAAARASEDAVQQARFLFSVLKRGGKVHVVIIQNARSDTLFPIIRDRVRPDPSLHR